MKSRNTILDFFKGIAIIAVILYHVGLLTYGYLGVEIFLVVGGYLITKSRKYQSVYGRQATYHPRWNTSYPCWGKGVCKEIER